METERLDGICDYVPVVLEIEGLDREWVDSIKRNLLVEPGIIKESSVSCSIHRVPNSFRQHDVKAYVPEIVSIGPFHYDKRKESLQSMEEHKWRYLRAVVTRNGEDSLQKYLKAIKELEKEARECYSEIIKLDSNSFVEMMVLDGCFIIELFRRSIHINAHGDDPLLSLMWLNYKLCLDLLKLENQIPFFILQQLSYLMNISDNSLVEWALDFFNFTLPNNEKFQHSNIQALHLLHLLHSSKNPTDYKSVPGRNIPMIQCASELQRAGIEFKKGNNEASFMDIKFENGVIKIPPCKVEDNTNAILTNLVAFEQFYNQCEPYFTAYVTFMDRLINSNVDVGILSRREIIQNYLGSDEDIATMFNKIGLEIGISANNFYLLGVLNDIKHYYETKCHKWRAILKRKYFNSPWAIISVAAATILLLLTFVQVYFAAFPR